MRALLSNFTMSFIVPGLLMTAAVAFHLSYRVLHQVPELSRRAIVEADAHRGRDAIVRHGCGSCHVVPGIRHATGRVGPKSEDIGNQSYIEGVLANSSDNLALWIRAPVALRNQAPWRCTYVA